MPSRPATSRGSGRRKGPKLREVSGGVKARARRLEALSGALHLGLGAAHVHGRQRLRGDSRAGCQQARSEPSYRHRIGSGRPAGVRVAIASPKRRAQRVRRRRRRLPRSPCRAPSPRASRPPPRAPRGRSTAGPDARRADRDRRRRRRRRPRRAARRAARRWDPGAGCRTQRQRRERRHRHDERLRRRTRGPSRSRRRRAVP